MSLARKCDRCGALMEPEAGQLTIPTLHVYLDSGGDPVSYRSSRKATTWEDIDFCLACSCEVLIAIGSAIDNNPTTAIASADT